MSLQGIIRPPVGFFFVGSHKNHSWPHAVISGGGAEFIIPCGNRVAALLQIVMDSCILFIVIWGS